MCVINLKRRVKGPVVAWKIFRKNHGRLTSVTQRFNYKINKLQTSGPPGFQAFVHRKDAERASHEELWLAGSIVRKVFLYQAAEGIIDGMSVSSNGRQGWTAREIRVPKIGS